MTLTELKSYTRKELAELAKLHRVSGWHPMKKDELIQALISVARSGRKPSRPSPGSRRGPALAKAKKDRSAAARGTSTATPKRSTRASLRTGEAASRSVARRQRTNGNGSLAGKRGAGDQLTAQVRDLYWIEAHWELSQGMIERAEAALAMEWHQAQPIIRLYDVTADELDTVSKTWIRDIPLRGDVQSWFVEVEDPTRTYLLHIGYRVPSGKFFAIARSGHITPAKPGTGGPLARPLDRNRGEAVPARGTGSSTGFLELPASGSSSSKLLRFGQGAGSATSRDEFFLQLDAELIVHGVTHPQSELTVMGTRVPLESDGTFSVRLRLTEGRQVIPTVAVAPNGSEERTIVLAVERNTKELEPHVFDEIH